MHCSGWQRLCASLYLRHSTTISCLFPAFSSQVPGISSDMYFFTLATSIAGGLVVGFVDKLEPQGELPWPNCHNSMQVCCICFRPCAWLGRSSRDFLSFFPAERRARAPSCGAPVRSLVVLVNPPWHPNAPTLSPPLSCSPQGGSSGSGSGSCSSRRCGPASSSTLGWGQS